MLYQHIGYGIKGFYKIAASALQEASMSHSDTTET